MAYLSDKTFKSIASAISDAEAKSDCEIVAVFAAQSDDYRYIPMLWAAAISLFLPYALYTLLPLGIPDLSTFALTQWLVFMLLAILFRTGPLHLRVVPKAVRQKRAEQQAHLQFMTHGLNNADSPPALLFFVSFEERYVRILTNANVPIADEKWQQIINTMIERIRAGEKDAGMIEAVRSISETLEAHCPSRGAQKKENRYPNQLIRL